jgi:hypothetical protein
VANMRFTKVEAPPTEAKPIQSSRLTTWQTSKTSCIWTSSIEGFNRHHIDTRPQTIMADTKIAAVQARLQESSRDFQKLENGECGSSRAAKRRLLKAKLCSVRGVAVLSCADLRQIWRASLRPGSGSTRSCRRTSLC